MDLFARGREAKVCDSEMACVAAPSFGPCGLPAPSCCQKEAAVGAWQLRAVIAIMGSALPTALGEILEVTRSDKKMEKQMQVQH